MASGAFKTGRAICARADKPSPEVLCLCQRCEAICLARRRGLFELLHYREAFEALRGSRVVGVAAPLTSRGEGPARVLLKTQQALAPAVCPSLV